MHADARPLPNPPSRADVMGMPATHDFWTADMVRALPRDGKRYETVHGELLVSPSPRPLHEFVLQRLALRLGIYLLAHPVGVLCSTAADISWGPDILVQPDLFVVDTEQARTLDWANMTTLLLTAEVLSPSSLRADRFAKRTLYQRAGVALYWIVDADARSVEVWTPDARFPAMERDVLRWSPAGATRDFELTLDDLFAPI